MIARGKSLGREIAGSSHRRQDREVRLPAHRGAHVDDIGELEPRLVEGSRGLRSGRVGRLHALGERGGLRHERVEFGLGGGIALLHRTLEGADALGQLLLLGTQVVVRRLLRSTLDIERGQSVDESDVLAAATLRFTQFVGGFTKQTRVDHEIRLEVQARTLARLPLGCAIGTGQCSRHGLAPHLLELGARSHLLREERGLDSVEEPLEPAHELGLGNAQLRFARDRLVGEGEGEALEFIHELWSETVLELTEGARMDVAQAGPCRLVERCVAHLLEELADHRADAHDLGGLLHERARGWSAGFRLRDHDDLMIGGFTRRAVLRHDSMVSPCGRIDDPD